MKSQKGFSLIEVIIVVVIVGIIITLIIVSSIIHKDTQCIGGYLFTNPISTKYSPGNAVQILDSRGKGIECRDEK